MTRHLNQIDLIVVISYLLLIFVAGMWLSHRAGSSVDEFFVGGRHMPWWLIGVSMAAIMVIGIPLIRKNISLIRFSNADLTYLIGKFGPKRAVFRGDKWRFNRHYWTQERSCTDKSSFRAS